MFSVNVSHNFHPSVSLFDIPNTPKPLAHIKIEILDCNHLSTISQFISTTFAFYTLDQNNYTPQFYYDTLYLTNSLPFNGCGSLNISTITPNPSSAGTNDTVQISGYGFGNSKGNGDVFLPDANFGGGSHYLHLDSLDYISWTDSLITFVLPSIVDSIGGNPLEHCPGSGIVKVQTNSGDTVSSPHPFTILFAANTAIVNSSLNPTHKIFNHLLPPYDHLNTFGAYIIRPDTSISNHPDRLACLDKAIKKWVCLTNINYQLGTDTIIQNPLSTYDDVTSVYFADLGDSTTIATTYQSLYHVQNPYDIEFAKEFDLVLNTRLMFKCFADTNTSSNVLPGKYDLYHVLLHELGHGHSLNHVNDVSAVMYYGTLTSGQNASDRHLDLYYDQPALQGGIWTIANSSAIDSTGAGVYPMRPGSANCTGIIGFNDEIFPNLNLLLYPNPTINNLYVSYKLEKSANVNIYVYNLFGQIIYSRTNVEGELIEIPLADSPSGFYLVKFQIDNHNIIGKVIKQ